jgi:hypothetical protein
MASLGSGFSVGTGFFEIAVGCTTDMPRPKIPASIKAIGRATRDESGLLEAFFGLSMPKF